MPIAGSWHGSRWPPGMNKTKTLIAVTTPLLVAGLLSQTSTAAACSAEVCGIRVVPADGSTVPSNLPGLLLDDTAGSPHEGAPFTQGAPLAPPLDHVTSLHIDRDAVDSDPNETSRFTLSNQLQDSCPNESISLHFIAAADFPTALGSLSLSGPEFTENWIEDHSTSCFNKFPVTQTMASLELHPSARPWAEALWLEMLIDGKPWRHSIPNANLLDDPSYDTFRATPALTGEPLLIACAQGAPATGISEGEHTIRYVGYLADGQHWETDEQTFSLRCPAAPTKLQTGTFDGGTPDSGSPANSPTEEGMAPATSHGACAINAHNRAGTHVASWLLPGIGLSLLRRRREPRNRLQRGSLDPH